MNFIQYAVAITNFVVILLIIAIIVFSLMEDNKQLKRVRIRNEELKNAVHKYNNAWIALLKTKVISINKIQYEPIMIEECADNKLAVYLRNDLGFTKTVMIGEIEINEKQ